jgi:hypothetical protein
MVPPEFYARPVLAPISRSAYRVSYIDQFIGLKYRSKAESIKFLSLPCISSWCYFGLHTLYKPKMRPPSVQQLPCQSVTAIIPCPIPEIRSQKRSAGGHALSDIFRVNFTTHKVNCMLVPQ